MTRDAVTDIAQFALRNFLCTGYTEHNLRHRYHQGRWDIYSLDIAEWHVLISDNGGKVIYASPCRS